MRVVEFAKAFSCDDRLARLEKNARRANQQKPVQPSAQKYSA
jgi:hypothetical protein